MSPMSTIIFLLVSLSTISMIEASPKERLKVKYKVKTDGKGEKVKMVKSRENIHAQSKNTMEVLNEIETVGDSGLQSTKSNIPDYNETVTTIMGQLERAARSGDL